MLEFFLKKKSKIDNKKKSGFTLIELLVSLAIFVAIVGGIVLFGVRTIQAYTRSSAMQSALENARFAIESMNKRIRTGSGVNGAQNDFSKSDEIFFVDNVTGQGFCYKFESGALKAVSEVISCDDVSKFETLVGGDKIWVEGGFYIKKTDAVTAKNRGFVRSVITVKYPKNQSDASPYERDTETFQSAVSLRDY